MNTTDILSLIHPALAVSVVFPIIGIVSYFAWQTRQRRLETKKGNKSKIAPVVGKEHVSLGKLLSGLVLILTLIGLAHPIVSNILKKELWQENLFQVVFIALMFLFTITSLGLLYGAKQKLWRAIFATLAGMGVVILGCQDGVFRRTYEWYVSHYYFGITVALLMIFSLAIIDDIYQDRTHKWRNVHIILNCLALLLFIGQGITGARDLLEVPLSWQKPFIYKCNFEKQTCPQAMQPQDRFSLSQNLK